MNLQIMGYSPAWACKVTCPNGIPYRIKTDNQESRMKMPNREVQLLLAYLRFTKPDDLQVCFIESTRLRVRAAFGSLSSIWNIDQICIKFRTATRSLLEFRGHD